MDSATHTNVDLGLSRPYPTPQARNSRRNDVAAEETGPFSDNGRSRLNTFKMNIQGHNERERGQSFYRAMMGQSDAVKVAMLKHRPYQRPVNHRTTIASPSVRWRGAPGLACRRVFPPRSRAHESRRLQRRDARPHPAPPRVLPPLRLEASRCARSIVLPVLRGRWGSYKNSEPWPRSRSTARTGNMD